MKDAGKPTATSDSSQVLVSGKWLLSAVGIVVAMAAICSYAALCLLFYQGSWQLIFHPSRNIGTKPGIPYQEIHFDDSETGKPQLNGWWIPASKPGGGDHVLLVLLDGRGSLADTVPQLETLASLGDAVFAFDYRGFGHSAERHPTEASLNEDADAAFAYLTDTRHLSEHSIVVYGRGLGASVAAQVALRHPQMAALVLEDVSPNALTLLAADARTKLLPVRFLTRDRFDTTGALRVLSAPIPKLFLDRGNASQTQAAFDAASTPKQLAKIPLNDPSDYLKTVGSFLDAVTASR